MQNMIKLKEMSRFLGIETLVFILITLFSLRGYLTHTIGSTAFSNNQFYMFVIAILCIAIAANTHIYFQRKSTTIIKENQLYYAFFTLNLIGLSIGIYLANAIEKSSFATLFGVLIFLIHSYGTKLQFNRIYKVLIPAFLISVSVLLLLIFDLLPLGKGNNEISNDVYFLIGVKLSVYTFILLIIINLKTNIDKNYSTENTKLTDKKSYWLLNIISLLLIIFLVVKSITIGLENDAAFYVFLLALLMPVLAFYIFQFIQKSKNKYLVYFNQYNN